MTLNIFYVEDAIDLCIRVKNSGSRIVFYPDAEVIHFTGRSGSQAHYLVVWQGVRGTAYHFLKHKGKVSALLVSAYWGGNVGANSYRRRSQHCQQ